MRSQPYSPLTFGNHPVALNEYPANPTGDRDRVAGEASQHNDEVFAVDQVVEYPIHHLDLGRRHILAIDGNVGPL
ncbi:hypothetical protein [Paraburkholderia sediminicola]|uniref:hypothetical protein n=1 Tax=Paraburkholderia sediminicola TaxID=458836 RepID=UPI0038B7C622